MDFETLTNISDRLSFYMDKLSECHELLELLQEQVTNPSLKPKKRKARIIILSREFCSSAECHMEIIQGEIKRLYELAEKL
jgi:hypothetical protein